MTLEQQIAKLSSAEDFFRFFDVAFDQAVVRVSRLHIMKRMGEYLSAAEIPTGEENARAAYAAQLERAYRDFVRSSPIEERVFKVHRSAISPPASQLVKIDKAGFENCCDPPLS